MSDFEIAVKTAAERSVLKILTEGSWIAPDYANRFKIPPDFLADVWQLIDAKQLKLSLARRLEEELADRILNHMAAEIATDVKQILSVKERREALRSVARQHMESIMQLGNGRHSMNADAQIKMKLKSIFHKTNHWALDRENALIGELAAGKVYVVPKAVAEQVASEYNAVPDSGRFESLCRLAILITHRIPLEELA